MGQTAGHAGGALVRPKDIVSLSLPGDAVTSIQPVAGDAIDFLLGIGCSSPSECYALAVPDPAAGNAMVMVPTTAGVVGAAERVAINFAGTSIACAAAGDCYIAGSAIQLGPFVGAVLPLAGAGFAPSARAPAGTPTARSRPSRNPAGPSECPL